MATTSVSEAGGLLEEDIPYSTPETHHTSLLPVMSLLLSIKGGAFIEEKKKIVSVSTTRGLLLLCWQWHLSFSQNLHHLC
jgi:hypothetical protein